MAAMLQAAIMYRTAPPPMKKLVPNVNSTEAKKPRMWVGVLMWGITCTILGRGVGHSTQSLQNLEMVLRHAPAHVLSCLSS